MTTPQRAVFGNPALLLARCLCVLLVAGCGGSATTDSSNSGGDVSASYAAAFASGAQSGTLNITTHSAGQASGTLTTVAGVTTTLSGTYSASTGSFTLSGGGYTFTGTTSASSASGSFTGPASSSGSFSGLTQATGANVSAYCGAWQIGNDFGWLNAVVIGSSITVIAGGPFSGVVGLTGTVSGSTFTGASAGGSGNVTVNGTLVTSDSISGTFARPTGSGNFAASKAACTSVGSSSSLSGEWATALGSGTTITVALLQVSSTLSGAGVITVQPGVPASNGGGGPPWTGDGYTVTSGSVSGTTVSFASTLVGKNPKNAGGFYYGTLNFTGTVTNGTTMTGTLTYTPTFTDSQIFTQQTATVTLTRQ